MLLELQEWASALGLQSGSVGLMLPGNWFTLFHVATAFASVLAVFLMSKTLILQALSRQPAERLLLLSQQLVWTGVAVLVLSLGSSLANYLVASSSTQGATTPEMMMRHSRSALSPFFGGLCTLIGCLSIRFHVLWRIHLGQR